MGVAAAGGFQRKGDVMRGTVGAGVLAAAWAAVPAGAAPLAVTPPVNISIANPFAPGCGGATDAVKPPSAPASDHGPDRRAGRRRGHACWRLPPTLP
jgi:hypothetical protein